MSLENIAIPETSNLEEISSGFNDIAQLLLNKSKLIVKGKEYRMVEIEFYYFNDPIHPDPFTYKSPGQQMSSQWYLHRYQHKNLVNNEIIETGFKSGKHKGLDITFGDRELNTYGGILLRGMVSLSGEDYVSGPCRVVNGIMEDIGLDKNNVNVLHEFLKERNITKVDQPIRILPFGFEQRSISQKFRVGLTNKMNDSNKALFISKPYNYFIAPF